MSFTKTHLKTARECITKKDYASAKKHSLNVLDFEPENYNAHVFLGLALLELGEYDESEHVYRKATRLNPSQPLAWQGLAKFYEKREQLDKLAETLVDLIELFNKDQDAVKCAEAVQKMVDLRRRHGTSSELIEALKYYMSDSEVYPLLSTLPSPDPTNPTGSATFDAQDAIHNGFRVLQEVLSLTESQEEGALKREVERRRTRLGAAGLEQIKKEVYLEISAKSQLPALYDAFLNHPSTSDELRVDIEAKQLRHKYKYLSAIPSAGEKLKRQLSNELDELVDAIVLLHKPDELGWKLYFEGKDCEEISEVDQSHVRDYIRLFPSLPLSTLFNGYFAYKGEWLWTEDDDEVPSLIEDPLDTVLNAYSDLSDTILGNKIAAEIHLQEEDYENTIKASKRGLQVLKQSEIDSGKTLRKSRNSLQVTLATALVHFFPPKHHKEATHIFDEVLGNSPRNSAAWMGRAFILQAASEWGAAMEAFEQVSSLLEEDTMRGLRAREESAWCRCQLGQYEEALYGLQHVLELLNDIDKESINPHRARCLWRIGKCLLSNDVPNADKAYKYFIQALKMDPEFAPAFTSLGIYYLELASPPDPIRSSKCFQKAFELDARETLAARRLVEGFANDKEWDLVEVIAQRTIDGEGGLNAGLDKSELDASTRYLPTNAWAWKAIGVVKFHYKDYPAAIQAFQVCLRVEPEDGSLWVRLGEAYAKAGRHAAAVKALNHALELDPDDWVCSYFIAEVKHQMGLFEDALHILGNICQARPDEAGPLWLVGQTHLDLGLFQLGDSFQIRAEESFLSAIEFALDIIRRMPGIRTMAWKMIGDATSYLSSFSTFIAEDAVRLKLRSIQCLPSPDWAEKVVEIVGLPSFADGAPPSPLTVGIVAIHSYLSQISLSSPNHPSNQASWYDLAVALQSWVLNTPQTTSSENVTFIKEKVVEYFKKALQEDPGNDIYWVGLGNACFSTHARAAQHAYIKALDIDGKNAATWVNLGLLYFHHGDVELANSALHRAQVLDPDNTAAWVGQFLVASVNNDKADATLLLEHAVTLSKPVEEADYEFAFRVFNTATTEHRFHRLLVTLLPAFFTLSRYCQQRSNDATALHLLSLVCERLGQHTYGANLAERSIAILETAYEETEDPEVEMRYTIANCTLGRLRLSLGQFEGAATSFESAHGLLADRELQSREIIVLRVQVHLGLGLANFFLGDLEASLRFLEEGLQIASANDNYGNSPLRSHLVIFLAQVLWAIGTEGAKEGAKSRLLECIASDPENLNAINTLAGMGILTADNSLVDAALSEILALPLDQKRNLGPHRHVDYLLIQHYLSQNDTKQAVSVAYHAVYADPASLDQRNWLADLILREGGRNEAVLALLADTDSATSASNNVDAVVISLCIQAVALTSVITSSSEMTLSCLHEALCKSQRAVLMRPWEARGWQTLAYVRSKMA